MRAGCGEQRLGHSKLLFKQRVTFLRERTVAGELPRGDGLLNKFEFSSGEEWAIEWDVQTKYPLGVSYEELTAAADNDSRNNEQDA